MSPAGWFENSHSRSEDVDRAVREVRLTQARLREGVRHEALLGSAMLGLIKARGWVQMPLVFDVNRAVQALERAGGVLVECEEAVGFARGLVDQACEANGWAKPSEGPEWEETVVLDLLRIAYDELVGTVGRG